ncbi:MAG: U32 family peptidase [Candidatus Omnitrophica bacterium]|nr:U32 family peptidase [Candidatus Omnitrophota bacterium]
MIKVLAPINRPEEVEQIIKAGADELYCGVLPENWKQRYSNIASPNRREWTSANLSNFGQLREIVKTAHSYGVPVYFAVNAFFTEQQYPLIMSHITEAKAAGVDALIVADIGLMLNIKEANLDINIHISNCGTAFNSETVEFYRDLGASRIVLPRQLMIDEIDDIAFFAHDIELEVFILNSGCKNIDGFCTFHHGVNEVYHPFFWNLFKKLNFDRYFLKFLRKLPGSISSKIKANIVGVDSACLLNYKIFNISEGVGGKVSDLSDKVCREGFNLLSGADTCGACDLYRLNKIDVKSVKIVGRNYSTSKKVSDVEFVKKSLLLLVQDQLMSKDDYKMKVVQMYKEIYGMACNNYCYRF